LFRHLTDEGYVPDKRFILYYLDQDGKEQPSVLFTRHSKIHFLMFCLRSYNLSYIINLLDY